MRRRIVGVLAVLVVSSVLFAAAPAGALSSMSASVCVDPGNDAFEFDITVYDVESDAVLISLLNEALHGEEFWATIGLTPGDGAVGYVAAPSLRNFGTLTPRDTWSTPFTDVGFSSVAGTTEGWDVTFTGTISPGTDPFSSGETMYMAFALDDTNPQESSRIFSVDIGVCGQSEPTTTTSEATTTTSEATTTTSEATTTTSEATTTTSGETTTTAAATTTISEVETDIADSSQAGVALFGLVALGFLALAAAAALGRHRTRNG